MLFKSVPYRRLLSGVVLVAGISGLGGCSKDVSKTKALRVGTSGDYAPFSVSEGGGRYNGFDIELAKHFAADHGLRVKFVQFRWPDLLKDLEADKFDVAMSGVTVRFDRSLVARFTVPVATSGAVVIIPPSSAVQFTSELNSEGIRIGVNAGGHLERVAKATFDQSAIMTSLDNQSLPDMLLSGEVDALVTDTLEAPHWLQRLPGAKMLPPITKDRKAWLVQAEMEELARRLDEWMLAREADGMLKRMRQKYLGGASPDATASPLQALLAAMDERLSLMVSVAESKRVLGKPVEDLEQEARVLESAVEGVRNEALREDKSMPSEEAVRAFFKAQIKAAKAIQFRVLEGPAEMGNPPDLVNDLRPALGRISEKINYLILELDNEDTGPSEIQSLTSEALSSHELTLSHSSAIAESLTRLYKSLDK